MNALLRLTVANTKSFVRDRAALFWTVAFPLIFVVIFGLIFSGNPARPRTASPISTDRGVGRVKAAFDSVEGVSLVDGTEEACSPRCGRARSTR